MLKNSKTKHGKKAAKFQLASCSRNEIFMLQRFRKAANEQIS